MNHLLILINHLLILENALFVHFGLPYKTIKYGRYDLERSEISQGSSPKIKTMKPY